jgi:hypothetical protein
MGFVRKLPVFCWVEYSSPLRIAVPPTNYAGIALIYEGIANTNVDGSFRLLQGKFEPALSFPVSESFLGRYLFLTRD